MRYLIPIFLLFISNSVFSQQSASINWGPEYKKDGGMFSFTRLIGNDDKYFYVLSKPTKDPAIYKYNYKGEMVSTTKTDLNYGKLKLGLGDVFELNGQYYVSLPYRNKREKTAEVYTLKMDKGKITGKHKLVFKVPFAKGNLIYSGIDATDGANINVSPNNTHVAFFGSQISSSKKESLKITVYKGDMDKVWQKVFVLPGIDRKIRIEQSYVDDEGNAYITAKVWDSENARKKGMPSYQYKIYKFNESGKEEYVIKLGSSKAPTDAGIFFSDDKKIRIGGMYTERSNPKIRANGVFFATVDGSGKVDYKANKFDDAFLEDLLNQKQINKGRGLSSYNINDLIQFADGSFAFIAEQFYITTHTTRDANGNTTTTTYYHTDEIIVPRFSADGQLISIAKIDKNFKSTAPAITGYAYASDGKNLFILYNDQKKRSEKKEIGKGGKRAVFTDYARIDAKGDVDITHMFDSKETDKYFYPGMSLNLNNDKLLIYVIKKKKFQFGTLTLK